MGGISIVEVIISVVLFFVMFFGIGFLINMLLRVTWMMALVYPIIVILIVDEVSWLDYLFKPTMAWPALVEKFTALHTADIVILAGGLAGAIVSGITMRMLRAAGYRMF